jgi:hypothetical protein
MTIYVLAAALILGVAAAAMVARHRKCRPPASMLDEIMWLAGYEQSGGRGWLARKLSFGWRNSIRQLAISGVPVNILTTGNWLALITPGLRRIFHERMRDRSELFKRTLIFPVEGSQRAYEEHQGIGELGTEVWNEFERTGRIAYDTFSRGFKTTLTHHEFAMGVLAERKLIEDNLYPGAGIPRAISGRVEKIADSAAVKREKSAATLLNNAFTGSGVDNEGFPIAGPDGVALCSASHPNGPEDSTTQSNAGVLTLTQDNVTATKILMRKFKDDRGELVAINPNTLIVPPELEEAATIVNNTPRDVGTAFNDINVQAGRWDIISWDYLTDATRWFMADSVLKNQHLVWYDRIAPEYREPVQDPDTLAGRWTAYMRYARGFDDWRWVFGQDG